MNCISRSFVLLALFSGSAVASITVPFQGNANYAVGAYGDPTDGETVGPFNSYDFAVGATLLQSENPANTGSPDNPAVGDQYNGYLQTYVIGHNNLAGANVPALNLNTAGAGGGYELTIALDFLQTIDSITPAPSPLLPQTVNFSLGGGTLNLYLDDTPDFSFAGDSGFTDNGAILSGSVIGGQGAYIGNIVGVTTVTVRIDSFDADVFAPDVIAAGSSVFTLQFQESAGALQVINEVLGGNASVQGMAFDQAAGDLLLAADGNLVLQAVVPLPAAAWLFGSALLGMLGLGIRRRAST